MKLAIVKELSRDYLEAAELYEIEINNPLSLASLETYINLAFLYWSFAFEFSVPEDIVEDYSILGGERYPKIIELGIDKYPNSLELHFWKRYFSHIVYSEEFSVKDCEQLIERYATDESKVPYFFLYIFNNEMYIDERRRLLDDCNKLPTAKNIYIRSIIG